MNEVAAAGRCRKDTFIKMRSVIAQSIDYAMKHHLAGYPPFNPAQLAKLPHSDDVAKAPPRPRQALDLDEAKALIKVALDHPHGPLVVIPLYVALRPGEVAGLAWEQVDFERRALGVRQSRRRDPRKNKGMVMVDPKVGSFRTLRMSPGLSDYLRQYRDEQEVEHDLVVCDADGEPLHPDVVRSLVKRMCKDAGITWPVTPNELRTTAATNLSKMLPLEEARQVMGHRSESPDDAPALHQDAEGDRGRFRPWRPLWRSSMTPHHDAWFDEWYGKEWERLNEGAMEAAYDDFQRERYNTWPDKHEQPTSERKSMTEPTHYCDPELHDGVPIPATFYVTPEHPGGGVFDPKLPPVVLSTWNTHSTT